MKVLMTLDAVGGVWQHALDLAAGLHARDVRVVLAGLGPRPDAAQLAQARDIGPVEWGEAPLDWLAAHPEDLAPVARWLDGLVAKHEPNLLHLNLPTQAVGLTSGLPVLAMSHSCLATWFAAVRGSDVPPDMAWQRDMTARGLAHADIVVAPSRSHADALVRCYGPLPGLTVVHNSSRAAPVAGPRQDLVVAAGRWWDDGKNGATLDVAAASTRWPVTMIGATDGPNGASIALTHAHQAGTMPHARTLAAIGRAGIFCAPSLYEPFGLAVLEAARAATPLVLAEIPIFRELWDGAAVFFPPTDAPALSASLNRLTVDPQRRADLGRAARARADWLTPDAQVDAMRRLYCRLADAAAPAIATG
ncbi:glycosyltransferase family 4 protein [Paracoccus beibuensis]|uniref:glycosyltransferase family 4 protein n=1 Tax=Paracoccus beibuensis TaxID=547602 RepID=UPI00223F7244|nr:glycosyltransferase family 4 protein [Paracoccus beibuensis]